jgi:L-fucono-1,5-lactonase
LAPDSSDFDRRDRISGPPAVDAHHHLWNPAVVPLPWLRPEHAPIARAFEPDQLEPLLHESDIAETILVQSACSDEDTDFMLAHAARRGWIAAVVAWVDLQAPGRAAERLDELAAHPKLRGIRHLIHDEDDPHWILRPAVLESLALLEKRGLILELPVVFPRHLGDVPELARSFPRLAIVVDHLGKPPLGTDTLGDWARELAAAAEHPNVAAKISGLNTAIARTDWTAADLQPAVDAALDSFGRGRLVCGSDWPVALLNGDYRRVWAETRRVLAERAPAHLDDLLAGNARRLYALDGDGAH